MDVSAQAVEECSARQSVLEVNIRRPLQNTLLYRRCHDCYSAVKAQADVPGMLCAFLMTHTAHLSTASTIRTLRLVAVSMKPSCYAVGVKAVTCNSRTTSLCLIWVYNRHLLKRHKHKWPTSSSICRRPRNKYDTFSTDMMLPCCAHVYGVHDL